MRAQSLQTVGLFSLSARTVFFTRHISQLRISVAQGSVLVKSVKQPPQSVNCQSIAMTQWSGCKAYQLQVSSALPSLPPAFGKAAQ